MDIGEDHLGIDPALFDHPGHVLGCEEVRHSSKLLSSHEGKFVVFQPVLRCVALQRIVVKGVWEEIVNEGTKGETAGPRLCEVDHVNVGVVASPALAPDEDRLHLRAQRLLARDAELYGQTGVGADTSAFGIPGSGRV